MAKAIRSARIAAMLTLLALPSCVTVGLWGSFGARSYTEPLAIHVTQTCVVRDADGTLTGLALQIADEDGPLGADVRGKWLLLDLPGHLPEIAAFFDACARGLFAEPELTIELRSRDGRPALDFAIVHLRARIVAGQWPSCVDVVAGNAHVMSPAAPQWIAQPADTSTPFDGDAPTWKHRYSAAPPVVVIGKVVLTPVTVAVDVVTLPVQLVLARR